MGRKYPQIEAGQEVVIDPKTQNWKMACCDCGLVHVIDFEIRKGKIVLKAYRNNHATGQIRRHMKKLEI